MRPSRLEPSSLLASLLLLLTSVSEARAQSDGFDRLTGDVAAHAEGLCSELETAPRGDVDRLKAEYADFRRVEEAELDRISRDAKALEVMQRDLDRESDRLDDWEDLPADDPLLTTAEATLKARRDDVSSWRVTKRTHVEQNQSLIMRRNQLAAASEKVRAADRNIASLKDAIRRIEAGEITPEDNALGAFDQRWADHNQTALEQNLANEESARQAALRSAGEALFMATPPENFAAIAANAAQLNQEWQALQIRIRSLDDQITKAEAAVQSALEAKAAAQAELRASRRQAFLQAKEAHASRVEDFRARAEQQVVDRTLALLGFQLFSTVADCIARREARLDEEDGATSTDEIRHVRATITETCYGAMDSTPTEVTPSFTFDPAYWHLGFYLLPGGDIKIANAPYLTAYEKDQPDPPGIGRARLGPEGRFSIKTEDPSPQNYYFIPPGQPADGTGERFSSPHMPFEAEGWLKPDQAGRDGFVGAGSGVASYRRVETRWGVHFHRREPCRITWTVP